MTGAALTPQCGSGERSDHDACPAYLPGGTRCACRCHLREFRLVGLASGNYRVAWGDRYRTETLGTVSKVNATSWSARVTGGEWRRGFLRRADAVEWVLSHYGEARWLGPAQAPGLAPFRPGSGDAMGYGSAGD